MIVRSDKTNWPTDEAKLWKYMDFAKFVAFLETKVLFFCRSDKLRDQNEFPLPIKNFIELGEFYGKNRISILKTYPTFDFPTFVSALLYVRQFSLVNSWHMNSFESVAMWNLYSKSNQGIAITTTFDELKKELDIVDDEVIPGKINYIDLSEHQTSTDIVTLNFLKTQSYYFEEELRFLIIDNPTDIRKPTYDIGKPVSVEPKAFIKEIFVSPNAENWYFELTQKICDNYKLDIEVRRSSIDDKSLK